MKQINSIAFVLTMLISVSGVSAIKYSEKTQKIIKQTKESGTQYEKAFVLKLYTGNIGEAYFKARMDLLNEYRKQIKNGTREEKNLVVKLIEGYIDEACFNKRMDLFEKYRKQIENGMLEEKNLVVKLVDGEIDEECFKARIYLLNKYKTKIERLGCQQKVFNGSYVGRDIEMKYAISMFDEGLKSLDPEKFEKYGREYHRLYMIGNKEVGTTPSDVLVCQLGNMFNRYRDDFLFFLPILNLDSDGPYLKESKNKTLINIKESQGYLYEHIAGCSDEKKCKEMLSAIEKLGFDFSENKVSDGQAVTLVRFSSGNEISQHKHSFADKRKSKPYISNEKRWEQYKENKYLEYDELLKEKLRKRDVRWWWWMWPMSSSYPFTYRNGEVISAMDFAVFAKNIPMIKILFKKYGVELRAKLLDRFFDYKERWEYRDKDNNIFLQKLFKLSSDENNQNLAFALVKNKNDKLKNSEALIKIYLDQKEAIKSDKLKQLEDVAINRMEHDCKTGEYGKMLKDLESDKEMAKAKNSKRCIEAKKIHALLLAHVKQAEDNNKQ